VLLTFYLPFRTRIPSSNSVRFYISRVLLLKFQSVWDLDAVLIGKHEEPDRRICLHLKDEEVQETEDTAIIREVVNYHSKSCKIPSGLNFEMF